MLVLLPAQREFTTEDGLTSTLSLKLDTVNVEVSGYGSSTRQVSATRSYPNLAGQDTSYIPKEITDNGRTLELASIDWQTDNTANEDGYAVADRYTAIATYTGSATSSYVTSAKSWTSAWNITPRTTASTSIPTPLTLRR